MFKNSQAAYREEVTSPPCKPFNYSVLERLYSVSGVAGERNCTKILVRVYHVIPWACVPFQPIGSGYKRTAPPLRTCNYFYSLRKILQTRSPSNKWRPSKASRARHPAGRFGPVLMSLLRYAHTLVFAESNSDSYSLSYAHIQTHINL